MDLDHIVRITVGIYVVLRIERASPTLILTKSNCIHGSVLPICDDSEDRMAIILDSQSLLLLRSRLFSLSLRFHRLDHLVFTKVIDL